MLSAAKNLTRPAEILRCAQHDRAPFGRQNSSGCFSDYLLQLQVKGDEMSAEMQAAVLHKYAAPPEFHPWSIPERGKGQVLVRVLAAPISPLDRLCASGKSYF